MRLGALSPKRSAAIALIMAMLLAILAACGGAPAAPAAPTAAPAADAPTAAPEAPTAAPAADAPTAAPEAPAMAEVSRADTLIQAQDLTDIITLDPAVAYEFGGILPVGNMYETLASFIPGGDGKIVPILADSWDIAKDGEQWAMTFKLNAAAKFASGSPVTGDDVIYSLDRAIRINKSPAFLLIDVCQIPNGSMSAPDAGTFVLKIPGEVSPQVCLSVLTNSIASVVEKALVQPNEGADMGESWLNDHSAGSGPYALAKWERTVSVILDANPNYWGAAPAIKRVIIQNTPDLTNLVSSIETGDVDIVDGLGADQMASLEGNPDITLVKGLDNQLAYVGMNATKAPLDNPDVREAIRYAINYDDIVTLLGGSAQTVQEILPIGFLGHAGTTPFTQDIAKAKELLAKAGVAEGTEIQFTVATGIGLGGIEWATLAAKIKDDVEKTGLKLTIQQLQGSELLKLYRAQGLQMMLYSWGPDFPDPDTNATPFANYEAKSLAWRNAWDDPKAIEMSKAAVAELDPAKREVMYKELVDYVQHNGPYAMLYQATRNFAVRTSVKGFIFDPVDTPSESFWIYSKQ
ncbi:ABC transporter substrate-binding protein [Oscillochloris sp. ZM17-4]|uniref:ABC transporter substrate-binding protein n=1 Tax=Oscillochloris sp. ZM17-4 TaxID=2866714 RepID=UPI001C72E335|nr:ABC transporter substrate-binding protein [Oscillochloris sp. ZM17-4]MBX0328206.1 ABC transporter substrate-binding protein [Oscillochloris sp. ZM17-4]